MDINIDVNATITRVEERADFDDEFFEEDLYDESEGEETEFQVRLFLVNTVRTMTILPNEVEYSVIGSRRSRETEDISFVASGADSSHIEQLVYDALTESMSMDSETATTVKSEVAAAIMRQIQSFSRDNYRTSRTVFMNVDIDCSVTNRLLPGESSQSNEPTGDEPTGEDGGEPTGEDGGEPTGEDGGEPTAAQLEERVEENICVICQEPCIETENIIVTRCQHSYHSACIIEWLNHGKRTCPVCRFDLRYMIDYSSD